MDDYDINISIESNRINDFCDFDEILEFESKVKVNGELVGTCVLDSDYYSYKDMSFQNLVERIVSLSSANHALQFTVEHFVKLLDSYDNTYKNNY